MEQKEKDKKIWREVLKEIADEQDRGWDRQRETQAIPKEAPLLKYRNNGRNLY